MLPQLASNPDPTDSRPIYGPGVLRQVSEAIILLAVSVTIFRAFAAEGYLISTGSMAPSLLGYHKRVVCPSCHYSFPRGVPVEDSSSGLNANVRSSAEDRDEEIVTIDSELLGLEGICSCPNCGLRDISLADFPKNEGDQLLVHKNIYDVRDPHRWEVVVFQNPDDPAQPYVKRVVGLPGETIRLHDGNVYANGQLQRKPLSAQRGVRIPVDDHDYEPDANSADWQPRWKPLRDETRWLRNGRDFRFEYDRGAPVSLDWVSYRNWVREGGAHRSEVSLPRGPVRLPPTAKGVVRVDPLQRKLVAEGAMPAAMRDEILKLNGDPQLETAVRQLYEQSHIAPITDHYGYNRTDAAPREFAVHDLMVSCDIDLSPESTFVLALSDDQRTFVCEFHPGQGQVFLTVDKGTEPIRQGAIPARKEEGQLQTIEFSVMDRQVLLAIDGNLVFEPLLYTEKNQGKGRDSETSRAIDLVGDSTGEGIPDPVRFAATGGPVHIAHLRLDRDVYYTPKNESEEREFVLGPSEFLVLGDNSPISVDSRAWDHPAIDRSSLIGKPFIVHLPSRQARWEFGGDVRYVRIPDFSKVRYIR